MLKCLLVTFLLTVSYKCVQCSTRLNFAPLFPQVDSVVVLKTSQADPQSAQLTSHSAECYLPFLQATFASTFGHFHWPMSRLNDPFSYVKNSPISAFTSSSRNSSWVNSPWARTPNLMIWYQKEGQRVAYIFKNYDSSSLFQCMITTSNEQFYRVYHVMK